MFDVAPMELMLVAVVALLVIGPKDLPKALRFVGTWVGKARGMARHFRSGLDTMMREAEMDDLEKKWRAHNDSVMQAYPDIASPLPADFLSPDNLAGQVPSATGSATGPEQMTPAAIIGPPAPPSAVQTPQDGPASGGDKA